MENFKMRRNGGELLRATENTEGHNISTNAAKTMGAFGMNYGTPSGLNSGTPDPFDDVVPEGFVDSRSPENQEEVGGVADSYETLEKKIVKAAKDDATLVRDSSSEGLKQTAAGNTQTSKMTQDEKNRMEKTISGMENGSSQKYGSVNTFERLKNIRDNK